MKSIARVNRQRGVALVVALLFLLVVTLLSVTAARNSSFSLQMSGNMQDQNDSLQSAEAAVFGALALANTGDDPFNGFSTNNPFQGLSPSPLDAVSDPNAVGASVTLTAIDRSCPRPQRSDSGGSSEGSFACDHYRIDGQHSVPMRARTRISLGVVKTVLASN